MVTLTIRNVDATVRKRLRERAARHGRSVGAEVRAILNETLAGASRYEVKLAEAIRRRIAPLGGVVLKPHPTMPIGAPPGFEM